MLAFLALRIVAVTVPAFPKVRDLQLIALVLDIDAE